MSDKPKGLLPLFVAGGGQELFEMRCDTDVTEDVPEKYIPIAKIRQGMLRVGLLVAVGKGGLSAHGIARVTFFRLSL